MAVVRCLRKPIARIHHQLRSKEQILSVSTGLRSASEEELRDVLQLIEHVDWPMKDAKKQAVESISQSITRKRFQPDKVKCVARWLMDPNLCKQRESSTAVTSVVYENIILSMAYVPELHSLAKQLLLQMINWHMTPTTVIEEAIHRLYHQQPAEFTDLLWILRDRGIKPSMNFYSMILDSTLKHTFYSNQGSGFDEVSVLLKMIIADWGKLNLSTYTVLLKNARDHSEVMLIWEKLKKSDVTIDKSVSEILFKVFLDKGEQSFNKWNQAIPHRKSIAQAHQLFVEDFLTAELNLSLKAVNTLLHACYRAGLADIALDVFHNLYKYQRTTPDEEGMRFLMCVLSKQLSRTPDTYKHLLNIWQGIKESHGGDPPLWCYVRFTEPVARFCSIEDFRYLLGIVISYNGKVQDLKLSLEDYNCLIRSCCTAGDKASAIHVLHYALSQVCL
jgi:hypothetical protein